MYTRGRAATEPRPPRCNDLGTIATLLLLPMAFLACIGVGVYFTVLATATAGRLKSGHTRLAETAASLTPAPLRRTIAAAGAGVDL